MLKVESGSDISRKNPLVSLMLLCTQGGRGPRGAPGPPGDNGTGLPGPKVGFHAF